MAYEACHDSLLGDSALLDQIRSVSFLIMSHHFSSFLIIFLIDILPRKKSPKSTEYLDESLVLGESTGAAASKLPRNFFSELHWLQLLRIIESTPQDSMRAPCSHIIECVYIYIYRIYTEYIYIYQVFSAFFISKVGTWLAPQLFFAARRRASSELIRPVGLRHEFCGVMADILSQTFCRKNIWMIFDSSL